MARPDDVTRGPDRGIWLRSYRNKKGISVQDTCRMQLQAPQLITNQRGTFDRQLIAGTGFDSGFEVQSGSELQSFMALSVSL
jgi:hypothetical protein